ncbi:hypothetical protein Tco_1269619 [Tanacetum coccineum]
MESVTQSDFMVLPYGMLLTCLYKHVHTTHPYAIPDLYDLVDHVMIPLTEGKARNIMIDGKRPHPQTPSESSSSPSPTKNQEENDPVNNYTLDPIIYMNQLPPIPGGESPKLKQTKGMFKCFGHFLSNLGKKNASLSTKNPPRKLDRTNVIDISSNEYSPTQNKNLISTTLNTTLALSITHPMISQTPLTQPIEVSPLALRALVFSTPPSSPIEPHPYLTSLEDLPPRSSNPPPPPPT